MTTPEFSRTLRVDTIAATPREMHLEAGPEERAALARRFGLLALDRLEAEVSIARADPDIVATGRLTAEAAQSCVVTAEPVPQRIDEPFEILFRQQPDGPPGADEEIELGEGEMDVVFYDGAMLDVGEAVAQSLGLALDPYPRAPGAAEVLKEAGVKDESEAGPFGALAALKDKLDKA